MWSSNARHLLGTCHYFTTIVDLDKQDSTGTFFRRYRKKGSLLLKSFKVWTDGEKSGVNMQWLSFRLRTNNQVIKHSGLFDITRLTRIQFSVSNFANNIGFQDNQLWARSQLGLIDLLNSHCMWGKPANKTEEKRKYRFSWKDAILCHTFQLSI